MAYMRLDRLLSNVCCIARGKAAALIRYGRVTVGGETVKKPEHKVDTQTDIVRLNGKQLKIERFVYIMMNKPAGVVCANEPNEKTVFDILPDDMRRRKLFTVGRLDKDTTGLLIITDDGQFVHNAASPKKAAVKRYIAVLADALSESARDTLRSGVTLADGTQIEPAAVDIVSGDRKTVEIGITHGRYHQVKRMAAAVGNRVESLQRIGMGDITLDPELAVGECRYLSESEIKIYK